MIRDNGFQFDDPMGVLLPQVEDTRKTTMVDVVFHEVGEKIFLQHCKSLRENREFLISKGHSERFVVKTLASRCWYH